jgi:hypothetical protein
MGGCLNGRRFVLFVVGWFVLMSLKSLGQVAHQSSTEECTVVGGQYSTVESFSHLQ